jgi:hypothetical protein
VREAILEWRAVCLPGLDKGVAEAARSAAAVLGLLPGPGTRTDHRDASRVSNGQARVALAASPVRQVFVVITRQIFCDPAITSGAGTPGDHGGGIRRLKPFW